MTIAHAISRYDVLYPNKHQYDEKLRWLSDLDEHIFQNVISVYSESADMTFDGYDNETDKQTELLIPFPFDDIYVKYLAMQGYKVNEDAARLVNSAAVFNAAYSEFVAWFIRSHSMEKEETT